MEHFLLFVGKDGKFYFNLKAGNNEIVLQSQRYESKQAAEKGIASVQENALIDEAYNRLISKDNKPYFTLEAKNGEVIGFGETYSSTQNRDKGIESVKKNGITSDVRDITHQGNQEDPIRIIINGETYLVSEKKMKGEEILALAGLSSEKYDLFLGEEDIKPNKQVKLFDGIEFQAIEKNIQFG